MSRGKAPTGTETMTDNPALISRINEYSVAWEKPDQPLLEQHPDWLAEDHQSDLFAPAEPEPVFHTGDFTLVSDEEIANEIPEEIPAEAEIVPEQIESYKAPSYVRRIKASAAAIATAGVTKAVRVKDRTAYEIKLAYGAVADGRDWLGMNASRAVSHLLAPENRSGRRQILSATLLGVVAVSALNRTGVMDMGVEASDNLFDTTTRGSTAEYPHTPPPPESIFSDGQDLARDQHDPYWRGPGEVLQETSTIPIETEAFSPSTPDSQVPTDSPLSRFTSPLETEPTNPVTDLPVSGAESPDELKNQTIESKEVKPTEMPDREASGHNGSGVVNEDSVSGEPIANKSAAYTYDRLTYSGDTIWNHAEEHLKKKFGYQPSEGQIHRATQKVLDFNELDWSDAKRLDKNFKIKIPKDL